MDDKAEMEPESSLAKHYQCHPKIDLISTENFRTTQSALRSTHTAINREKTGIYFTIKIQYYVISVDL